MRKLHPKFCGPFKIVEKINDLSLRLNLSEPMKARGIHDVFYYSFFKPYIPDKYSRYDHPLPPVYIQEGVEECEVEPILGSKKIRGKKRSLVKWKGYGDHKNTWQTRIDLKNGQDALKTYENSRRLQSKGEGML